MSDTSGAYPPPPPANVPPPIYGGAPPATYAPPPLPAGYQLPPGYQGPVAPDYSQPYQGYPQPYGQQPINPAAAAYWSASSILYQFGGRAIYANIAGVAAIAAPFVTGFYFPILPIFGLIASVRAIQGGRLLGGIVALGLNLMGGIVSLWASGLIG